MTRILQKDITPTAIRQRLEVQEERQIKATVGPLRGKSGTHKSIKKAIRDVGGVGGGVILLLNGTHRIRENLELKSDITLIGESQSTTILDFENSNKKISATGKSDIYIKELTIKNSGVADDLGAILFNNCEDSAVQRCSFVDNAGGGTYDLDIVFYECTRCDATNNETTGSGGLVRVFQGKKCSILENYTESTTKDAILLQSGEGNRASRNHIKTPGRNGIIVDAGDHFFVNSNFIDDWGSGHGIALGNAAAVRYGKVLGNDLSGDVGGGSGIWLNAKANSRNSINSNFIYTNKGDAIEINSGSVRTVINGNNCWAIETGSYGINIKATAQSTVVVGNSATGAAGAILDNGSNSEVAHNA